MDELLGWITGANNSDHDFSVMGDDAMANLVAFLKEGTLDVSPFIDEDNAAVGGDVANGESLYSETCSSCHADDGQAINFGNEDEPEYVGSIAIDNPWEFIHKVRAGQPGTRMPSAIELGWSIQDVVDLLSYSQTLPTEPQ
jgi:thiosulfate dehydrogenase